MEKFPSLKSFSTLAEFRYLLRKFLVQGDSDARKFGLQPQQYLLLLYIYTYSPSEGSVMQCVADRMQIKENSLAELIKRAERNGLIHTGTEKRDKRVKKIVLTANGKKILMSLVSVRLKEMKKNGPALLNALTKTLSSLGHSL